MRKDEVRLTDMYEVKVSGILVPVRVIRNAPGGGWVGLNLVTGREVRIKTAARLRRRLNAAEADRLAAPHVLETERFEDAGGGAPHPGI